ncbi:MAG: protein kinase [Acidobacteriota bacterium]
MARRPSNPAKGQSGGSSLGFGLILFGLIALLILLVAGSAYVVTLKEGRSAAVRSVAEDLGGTQAVQTALQQQRYERLFITSKLFATDQLLTSYLAEAAQARDEDTMLDTVEEYQNQLGFDLAIILDRNGIALTSTDRRGQGSDMSSNPLVAVALEESKSSGVLQHNGQLYHALCVPLVRQFELVGYIVIAYAVNSGLAQQVKRTGRAETTFLAATGTGPEVAASTLGESAAQTLVMALRSRGDVLNRVISRGETANEVELELGGTPWRASLAPLRDAAGGSVGAVVALASLEQELASYGAIRWMLLVASAASLVAGALLAFGLSGRMRKPMRAVADAAEQGALGNYEIAVPTPPGDAGRVGRALRDVFALVRERQAAEFVTSRIARLLPEPARSVTRTKPAAAEAALVAIDLRRFANPKIGYDPEENLNRFARDIQRISASAGSQKGKVQNVFGHRVLVSFEGENHAFRALTAAAEILLTLSERENVFDEPNPPVVAMTVGNLVTGSVTWGSQPSPAVAGLPLQILESLLREAEPGAIYFSRPVWDVLGRTFTDAGAEVKAQRGILSPQPLYLISGEAAGKVTGAQAMSETTTGFAGEGRSLSDMRPGVTLGSRFDILAELGAGRMGIVFKAQDRDAMDLVTLKLLRPEVVQDTSQFERLKRAVAKARTIRHPNVLGVNDFGEAERIPYIATEFARGMTLAFMLEQAKQLPLVAGVRLARQMAWGLAAAHGQQLMHGSLKPENILVEGGGTVKLLDFGLTVPVRVGAAVPSPGFLAPEQLEGHEPDSRADFYSWGAVVYCMLTGQLPFAGSSVDEIRNAIVTQDPQPISAQVGDCPPALEELVLKCLGKKPEQRFESADALVEALDRVVV